jgi:DNA processing protein
MVNLADYSLAAKMLALKMTGHIGPRTFELLLTRFGAMDNIFSATHGQLTDIEGIGRQRAQAIDEASNHLDQAARVITSLAAFDTHAVTCLDAEYPEMLHELNDPPMILYYRGALPAQNERRVAVIGSQDVSVEGIGDAVELSRRLAARGISIVSGLARGIDTAGHIGALKEKGKTYAVLPSGFNQIHPSENKSTADEISASGGLVSEYLPDTPVSPGRLLSRNRITVGLAQAVIIGEVAEHSTGTLDAALCCHQLGKLLFVVVGKHNPHFETLTQYGAIPLTDISQYELVIDSLV